jgi:hypothetical protein
MFILFKVRGVERVIYRYRQILDRRKRTKHALTPSSPVPPAHHRGIEQRNASYQGIFNLDRVF